MIRGQLKLLILKALEEGHQTGYKIRKYVKKKTAHSPSYGSIYPQLEKLSEEEILSVKKEGKKKKYSLTKKGKEELEKILEEKKEELTGKLEEGMKIFSLVFDKDFADTQLKAIQMMREGKINFEELTPEVEELKKTMLELWMNKKIQKHRGKIRKILKKANEELRSIQ